MPFEKVPGDSRGSSETKSADALLFILSFQEGQPQVSLPLQYKKTMKTWPKGFGSVFLLSGRFGPSFEATDAVREQNFPILCAKDELGQVNPDFSPTGRAPRPED